MKQENEKFEKYKEYARDITEGRIKSNKYIYFICQRYLSFFEREDLYFDIDTINKFENLIKKLKIFDRNNIPLNLLPFQWNIIYNIFGFRKKKDNKLLTKDILLFIGRKNAKSHILSIFYIFLLLHSDDASQLVLSAYSYKQSLLIFNMIKGYIRTIDPNNKFFQVYRDTILYKNTRLIVTSNKPSALEGLQCKAFSIDELSVQQTDVLLQTLETSQVAVNEPLRFYASTSNISKFNFGYEKIQTYFQMIDSDTLPLDTCPFLYCLENEEQIKDESNWILANPSLDFIVSREYLRSELEKCKVNPSNYPNILIKHFNLYVNVKENSWLDLEVIKNHSQKLDINNFLNDEKYILSVGFDLSVSRDLTSVSYNFIDIETNKNYIFTQSYLPISEYTEQNKNYSLYQRAKREKALTLIDSNVIDYKVVLQDMLNIFEKKRPIKIYYDSYNAHSLILEIMENGYNDDVLTPLSQSILQFNKITKEFERNLLTSDNIILNKSILTEFAFNNCGLLYDNNNNCKPVKKSFLQTRQKNGSDKIDPVISILQAFNYVLEQQENFFTIGN